MVTGGVISGTPIPTSRTTGEVRRSRGTTRRRRSGSPAGVRPHSRTHRPVEGVCVLRDRVVSSPAVRERTRVRTVRGSSVRPASPHAEYPAVTCSWIGIRKNMPAKSAVREEACQVRRGELTGTEQAQREHRRSSLRCSTNRNAANAAKPRQVLPSSPATRCPRSGAKAYVWTRRGQRPARGAHQRCRKPGCRSLSRLSGTRATRNNARTIASGTLMKKYPAPACEVDQRTADDRSGCAGHSADTRPPANCPVAVVGVERTLDQGQRPGHDERPSYALEESGPRSTNPCSAPHATEQRTDAEQHGSQASTPVGGRTGRRGHLRAG